MPEVTLDLPEELSTVLAASGHDLQRAALEAQVSALRESVDLALQRYSGGKASYIEVLDAEQQLFPSEDGLAQAERDQLLAVVNLYKALGGGWNVKDSDWTAPH